jgi:hypothetical protein
MPPATVERAGFDKELTALFCRYLAEDSGLMVD